MSLICKKCKKTLASPYTCPKCNDSFHPGCAKPEKVIIDCGDITCCLYCRKTLLGIPTRSRSVSPLSNANTSKIENTQVSSVTDAMASSSELQAIMARMDQIATSVSSLPLIQKDVAKLKDLKKTVDDISRKMGDVIASVEASNVRIDSVETSVQQLKEKTEKYHEQTNLRITKQYWDQEVAISGLNDELLKEPLSTISKLALALGIESDDPNAVSKFVVTRPSENKKKTLIVRFPTPIIRDNWLKAKREKRTFSLRNIQPNAENVQVYINERSTQA